MLGVRVKRVWSSGVRRRGKGKESMVKKRKSVRVRGTSGYGQKKGKKGKKNKISFLDFQGVFFF